ncbi:hypothetical protein [Stigmatella aurantiaca]|uniref:Conserved uncharacterized protein n=1 Tax=Stigmatella aurantiaca (strain DW4/3-1) TaxID=378806 RepID=Q096N1_STIAD|nr:hypothetical protein [Stigmatella aurantiaca]ADO68592.1 conserved uncharacterized protein [Stigmatella aurantiaca DW4/3-1]EAU67721.1 hypothetical protein STIAU_0493 [Stigmatella aurantiaca DW4/3-1]
MKKLWLVGALSVGASACVPDIAQDPPPNVALAQFDPSASPPVVPSPNDLAFDEATQRVNAPINPLTSPAEQEFTRDYLNTLNGFPVSAVATAKIADLDPSTINASTVRFIDLQAGTPVATPPVTPSISYNEDTDTLSIAPPATGWPKRGRYAVALIGGDNGLKGVGGKQVVGSATWSFINSDVPLVTCEELTAPDCRSRTDIIPSKETDPVKRLADQNASALRLEQLRRSYSDIIKAIVGPNGKREDVVLMWTYRIMDMPEVTFDPVGGVVPFPNDLLLKRTGNTTQVQLPIPPNASPTQQQLFAGLNTLDGFSTSSAIVSENGLTQGILEAGSTLDAANLATATGVYNLTGPTQPQVVPCISCASSRKPDGTPQGGPQQLQFIPGVMEMKNGQPTLSPVPLNEKTTYAAVLTTDLKDTLGKQIAPPAVFALLRLSHPLSVDGKSQVSAVSDAQAFALEPLRAGLKPLFDGLEASAKLPRSKIALAWAFTTQSTVSTLAQLYALPSKTYGAAGLPDAPLGLEDRTSILLGQMGTLPKADIGQIFQGTLILPFALNSPTGTLNPTAPRFDHVPFLLVLPKRPAVDAAVNWPVAIFSHALRNSHTSALAIANELAKKGFATLSYDSPFHGDRSSCTGVAAAAGLPSDDYACANPSTQRCETDPLKVGTYGRCVARTEAARAACDPAAAGADLFCSAEGQGRCASDSKCEGGTFGLSPGTSNQAISGWNFIRPDNLFATRDNFRQHAIDLGQAERVIQSAAIDQLLTSANRGTATGLDGTKIVYVGQSLGGMLGTLSTSVSENVGNVALNVPGGDLTNILLTSPHPDFVKARNAFLATLAAEQIVPGTPPFDQFIGLAKMVLDPADPVNYAYSVLNSAEGPKDRSALIHYITQDEVVPTSSTEALISAATHRPAAAKKPAISLVTAAEPQEERHGFLLNFKAPATTAQAQADVAGFLQTGTLP